MEPRIIPLGSQLCRDVAYSLEGCRNLSLVLEDREMNGTDSEGSAEYTGNQTA